MQKEMKYEEGYENFLKLKTDINNLKEALSEADTRCEIIDRFLKECLGWRTPNIRREKYLNKGYIDYVIRAGNHGLIVEAKRNLPLFELPAGVDHTSNLSIGNLLKKGKDLNQHYEQVSKYCLDSGIQFGCFTNGLEWVIFPAVRIDGINLHNSKVIIFRGIKDIENNFINFWNLFSKEATDKKIINKILLPESKFIPQSFRVNEGERRNEILNRNVLSGFLSPILPEYFGELTGDDSIDKLEKCYVESSPLSETTRYKRRLSKTVGQNPVVVQYVSRTEVYEYLDKSIISFKTRSGKSGVLYILLGPVGSGKSTFLNYYLYVKNKQLLKDNLVYFINWREYDEHITISDFFYEKINELSKNNQLFLDNSSYENLEKAFQEEIISLKKGPLGNIEDKTVIQQKIAELLMQIESKSELFYSRIFKYLKRKKEISTILIFDNIDQLDPELQEKILKFSISIYEKWDSFTLLSLREENYQKSKTEGSLSTIQCHQFHLPPTSIVPIIERRLECFAEDISKNPENISSRLENQRITLLDVRQYILLISESIVSSQDKVRRFLEAIALGNIRSSLEFFRNFLVAGNTDSGKIISKMKQSGGYLVPDYEFIKSLSLNSKRFFSEMDTPIINLFSISDMENPSHFTKLRILNSLFMIRFQSMSYGTGYESIERLITLFKEIGTSKLDIENCIKELTRKNLIENDLHSAKYLDKAKAVRILPTGEYYLTYLCGQFAYIDLMQQDTPLFDNEIYYFLNNLAESTKMTDRFKRVNTFLNYLLFQENNEISTIKKITNITLLTNSFMPSIQENCKGNIDWILKQQKKYNF